MLLASGGDGGAASGGKDGLDGMQGVSMSDVCITCFIINFSAVHIAEESILARGSLMAGGGAGFMSSGLDVQDELVQANAVSLTVSMMQSLLRYVLLPARKL